MRLKQVMALVIVAFSVTILYFLVAGYIFYKPPSPQAEIQEQKKMNDLSGPQSPPIIH